MNQPSTAQAEELIAIAGRIQEQIVRLTTLTSEFRDEIQCDIAAIEQRLSELENQVNGYDP